MVRGRDMRAIGTRWCQFGIWWQGLVLNTIDEGRLAAMHQVIELPMGWLMESASKYPVHQMCSLMSEVEIVTLGVQVVPSSKFSSLMPRLRTELLFTLEILRALSREPREKVRRR